MERETVVVRVDGELLAEFASLVGRVGPRAQHTETKEWVDEAIRTYLSDVKQGRRSLRVVGAAKAVVKCRECGHSWSTRQEGYLRCPKGHIAGWKLLGKNLVASHMRGRND